MDPVPTLGYVNRFIIPNAIDAAMNMGGFDDLVEQYAVLLFQQVRSAGAGDGNMALLGAGQVLHQTRGQLAFNSRRYTPVALTRGDTISGDIGTVFIMLEGAAFLAGGAAALDASAGADIHPGGSLRIGNRTLILAGGGSGLTVTSETAQVLVRGWRTVRPAYVPIYTLYADRLHAWNLFRGTNHGYELNRPATRLEGLILLIRLLGEESQALTFPPQHGFPDVPAWPDQQADRFVAYGLHRGYTQGGSLHGRPHFGASDLITADMYATFLLRALGYSDAAGGDFIWNTALDFAAQINLVPSDQVRGLRAVFMRDHLVYMSYRALQIPVKGTSETLAMRLGIGG
jgi:hypothetical protein